MIFWLVSSSCSMVCLVHQIRLLERSSQVLVLKRWFWRYTRVVTPLLNSRKHLINWIAQLRHDAIKKPRSYAVSCSLKAVNPKARLLIKQRRISTATFAKWSTGLRFLMRTSSKASLAIFALITGGMPNSGAMDCCLLVPFVMDKFHCSRYCCCAMKTVNTSILRKKIFSL